VLHVHHRRRRRRHRRRRAWRLVPHSCARCLHTRRQEKRSLAAAAAVATHERVRQPRKVNPSGAAAGAAAARAGAAVTTTTSVSQPATTATPTAAAAAAIMAVTVVSAVTGVGMVATGWISRTKRLTRPRCQEALREGRWPTCTRSASAKGQANRRLYKEQSLFVYYTRRLYTRIRRVRAATMKRPKDSNVIYIACVYSF